MGVIIGGLITWWIQKSLKNKELKLVVFRETQSSLCKILNSLTSLQFYLKELAYLEVDSKHQYHIYLNSTGEAKTRALEEHYNDYKYISDVKNKISNCVAETNSNFSSYYKLANKTMPTETSNSLLDFTKHILSLQRAKEFETGLSVTTEFIETKINSLSTEYTKHIDSIVLLANSL